MARVGEEFPLECPACGGDIRLIAFITEPVPIRKILTHLGEPRESPLASPARGPPTDWGELVQVTSRNAERQKVLPPPASDCHSRHEWLSSPSRIGNNRPILREKLGVGKKATQKTTHLEGHGSPQEIAGSRAGHARGLRHRQRLDPDPRPAGVRSAVEPFPPTREWPCRGPAACLPCG